MPDQVKTCTGCGIEKPVSEFWKHGGPRASYRPRCKSCAGSERQDYLAANPEVRRRSWLKRYGLTPEDYCRMLAEQGGVCKICGSPPTGKYLYVDHNHVTGVVRGLLCHSCNSALGYAKDDPELLRVMADYLDRRE